MGIVQHVCQVDGEGGQDASLSDDANRAQRTASIRNEVLR